MILAENVFGDKRFVVMMLMMGVVRPVNIGMV